MRASMYGPMHWLDDRHVTALLRSYICEGWDTGDYARFADLSGEGARRLHARHLPAHRCTRYDRQATRRVSPTCCALPPESTVSRSKDMSSRAPRWDERVGIDTVCVPESAIIAHAGRPIDDASLSGVRTLADPRSGPRAGMVGSDANLPARCDSSCRDASSARWWWAWWD